MALALDAPQDAYFDHALNAWILSRYDDVWSALRDPRLMMPGTQSEHDATHIAVREAASAELAADRLQAWRPQLAASVRRFVYALPDGQSVDLVRHVAEPWSLQLACLVTGLSGATESNDDTSLARRAHKLAQVIFASAASSTDGTVAPEAHNAASELARLLVEHGARDQHAASVQTFVALSHTLPALLAGAWTALFADALETQALRARPSLLPTAVGELLRLASPSRALFRQAAADVQLGEAQARAGDRVVLLVSAANRDAARFPEPNRLDVARDSAGQLAFGAGAHNCVGAALVRLALEVATQALIERATEIVLLQSDDASLPAGTPFAISAPRQVWVVMHGGNTSTESNR